MKTYWSQDTQAYYKVNNRSGKKRKALAMKKKYEKPELIVEVMSLDMLEGGCSGHHRQYLMSIIPK